MVLLGGAVWGMMLLGVLFELEGVVLSRGAVWG